MIYPEDLNRPELPDLIEVCSKCRSHIVVFLGEGSGHVQVRSELRPKSYCVHCGLDKGTVRFVRDLSSDRAPLQDTVSPLWTREGLQ